MFENDGLFALESTQGSYSQFLWLKKKKKKMISLSFVARIFILLNRSNIVEKKERPHIIPYLNAVFVVGENQGIQVEFKAKDQGGVWSSNRSFRARRPADGERVCDSFCVSLCLFNGTPGRSGSQGLPSAPASPRLLCHLKPPSIYFLQ